MARLSADRVHEVVGGSLMVLLGDDQVGHVGRQEVQVADNSPFPLPLESVRFSQNSSENCLNVCRKFFEDRVPGCGGRSRAIDLQSR